jgi:hypothetical protein
MSKNRFDFRLAIGSIGGPRSSVWHFWSRRSEVYATHGGMGGIEKFSFHTPNVCRRAFTKEYGTPAAMTNRASHEWLRDPTPPVGSQQVVRVLRIGFATDLLSTALKPPKRTITWVKPAPLGGSTVLSLMFTKDSEANLVQALEGEPSALNHTLIVYKKLPNGEAFCITSWFSPEADKTLRVPASHGHKRDLIVYPKDPEATGRPVRLTTFSSPKDGELIDVWEFGGYWSAPVTDAEWKAMVDAVA